MYNKDFSEEDIQNKAYIESMVGSKGWEIIDNLIKDKIEQVDLKTSGSDDPYVIMSCVRQKDGLMFIYEIIEEFISEGLDPL